MGSEDNDRERMRDIVERLELQAFVADKIQSGMKPLIMDCLNEITNLRIDNAKFYAQAEMNARLLTENASLRVWNEELRAALKPFAELGEMVNSYEPDDCEWEVTSGMLRAAAAAIRESGDE